MRDDEIGEAWQEFVKACAFVDGEDRANTIGNLIEVCISIKKADRKSNSGSGLQTTESRINDRGDSRSERAVIPNESVVHILFPAVVQFANGLPDPKTATIVMSHIYFSIPYDSSDNKDSIESKCSIISKELLTRLTRLAVCGRANEAGQQLLDLLCEMENYIPNFQLKGEHLYCDSKGRKQGKEHEFLPTKQQRRDYCDRLLFLLWTRKSVWDLYAKQRIQIETEKAKTPIGVQPLDIGWCQFFGNAFPCGYLAPERNHLWHYFEFKAPNYSNYFQSRDNEVFYQDRWTQPFHALDASISIPLFAYSVFSIIKPFFARYPSRINDTFSFRDVRRKQKRMIFVSLSGNTRYEVADSFCGMFETFCHYGEPVETESDSQKKVYQSRVHDGVVILEKAYRSYDSFRDTALLQDASCLCLNALFGQAPNEIMLRTDDSLSPDVASEIKQTITEMLKGFVQYIKNDGQEAAACRTCLKQIIKAFCRWYDGLENYKGYDLDLTEKKIEQTIMDEYKEDDLTWEIVRQQTNKLTRHFARMYDENEILSGYIRASAFHRGVVASDPQSSIGAARKRYEKAKSSILSESKSRFYNNYFHIDESLEQIDEPKYAYLYASLLAFCDYLRSENQQDFADSLSEKALQVLTDMCKQRTDANDDLSAYISKKLVEGDIIGICTGDKDTPAGWYDGKNGTILLPYDKYFVEFCLFWEQSNITQAFPYSQKGFERELSNREILVGQGKQKRPDWRIKVEPADSGKDAAKVIKIRANKLKISESAAEILKRISEKPVRRRSHSRKHKDAVT